MKATATEATERSIPAEDALRLVIDTTPTPIHTARPDGYIDYFNKAWLEFFGKSLEDVRGWRWTDVVHPEDVAGIVRKWQDALETGEPFEWETRVGLPMERMLGWEWTKAFHPDDIDELVETWKRAIATGTPFQDEGRVRLADGEYRHSCL